MDNDKIFALKWNFRFTNNDMKKAGDIVSFFSISVPKSINLADYELDEENQIVSFFANGHQVAKYHRGNDGSANYILAWSSNDMFEACAGTRVVELLLVTDEFEEYEYDLYNAEVPSADGPIHIADAGNGWYTEIDKPYDSTLCLYKDEWICNTNLRDVCAVKLNGNEVQMGWIDWKKDELEKVSFDLKIRGIIVDTLSLRNEPAAYCFMIQHSIAPYVRQSEMPIEYKLGNLANIISVAACNADVEVDESKLVISVAKLRDGFSEYSRFTNLQDGVIRLKLEYDGCVKYLNFFFFSEEYLKRLNDSTYDIRWRCGAISIDSEDNDTAIAVKDETSIKLADGIGDNDYRFINVHLLANGSIHEVAVSLRNPHTPLGLVREGHKALRDYESVAYYDLANIKLYLDKDREIKLCLLKDKKDGTTSQMLQKSIELEEGTYPIEYLKNEIDRLFFTFGSDDKNQYVELRAGTNVIKITNHSASIVQEKGEPYNHVYATNLNHEPMLGLDLFAIFPMAGKDSEYYHAEIALKEIEGDAGCYELCSVPSDQSLEYCEVYSRNPKVLQPARLYPFEDIDHDEEVRRIAHSIRSYEDLLPAGNEQAWDALFYCLLFAIKRREHFGRFTPLRALANNSRIQAMFILRLNNNEELKSELGTDGMLVELKRMEKELFFGFHFIPSSLWFELVLMPLMQSGKDAMATMLEAREQLAIYLQMLVDRFGSDNANMLFNRVVFSNEPTVKPFKQSYDYLSMLPVGALFDTFQYEVIPFNKFNKLDKMGRDSKGAVRHVLLQFYALALPQIAAIIAADNSCLYDVWSYNKTNIYMRRMLTYFAYYVTALYNDIFVTTITQIKNEDEE